MNTNPLKQLVVKQKNGQPVGIYSCCSANDYVIEAALECAKRDHSCVLIESTANQVDQNGGYTGMKPADFRDFVMQIADKVGFDKSRVFLGGDHLGPLTFANKNEAEAMEDAKELVRCYVAAGFTKIHIDTSMKVASDDPEVRLSDEIIARRGATLAKVCDETYQTLLKTNPDAIAPVYIVGSEVPIPGGAQDPNAGMQVTRVEDFKATVKAFKEAFAKEGLDNIWNDVIGVVVQPGVEEKDAGCTEYDRSKAADLMASIEAYPTMIFEGHSTDYQTKYKLKELIEDGVGILKVGPGLTYAMREALFALAYMEDMILHGHDDEKSNFIDVLEKAMLAEPKNWAKHYHGDDNELWFKRKFSFSDRSRYYMPEASVKAAKDKLIANLRKYGVSLAVLSQFMPIQYTKVRCGELANDPEELIKDRIKNTIDEYLFATHQDELFK
ncbi:MAG: tagatose-bisphosphate aldolase [Erysipelotrichia bacterium]|nr:tagatose-bisphosphate aldolase [Erysipelotrichia bacterium]